MTDSVSYYDVNDYTPRISMNLEILVKTGLAGVDVTKSRLSPRTELQSVTLHHSFALYLHYPSDACCKAETKRGEP